MESGSGDWYENETDIEDYDYYNESTSSLYTLEPVIFRYTALILFIVGTVGNLLSIVVWQGTVLSKKPSAFFITALAVIDLLVLYVRMGPELYTSLTGTALDLYSSATCNISLYLNYTVNLWAAWILVDLTAQRALVVALPLKARFLTTRKIKWITLLVTLVILGGMNIPILFSSVVVVPMEECQSNHYVNKVLPMLDLAIGVALPFIILFITNSIIIHKMVHSSKVSQFHQRNQVISSSVILVVISVAFLVLNLPVAMFILLNNLEAFAFYAEAHEDWDVIKNFILSMTMLLQYLNSVINFFLYCLSGATFRRELKLLLRKCLKCCSKCGQTNKGAPTSKVATIVALKYARKI